jgi:acetylglutamate kinase
MARARPTLVKFGGELLEEPRRLQRIARAVVDAAQRGPVIVVHGGGREVDAEMARVGLHKQAVDGLRITTAESLEIVLGVLAGRVNTRFVAALQRAGGQAVGLTGVDAGTTTVNRARRYRATDGSSVDLGFVGVPTGLGDPVLIRDLTKLGYIPVVGSIAADEGGRLFNVNADSLAGDLAARTKAAQLVIAGTTAGVLNADGRTIPVLANDDQGIEALIRDGQASAGMVAKLLACRVALEGGVRRVAIVDGTRKTFLNTTGNAGVTRVTNPRAAKRPTRRGRRISA